MEDLFDDYDNLPEEVKNVLKLHAEDDATYENCKALDSDLREIGYSCDFELDAVPHSLVKLKSMYNQEHLDRLAKETRLENCEHKIFDEIVLGTTEINISGKLCKVQVNRTKSGNIEITPIDNGIRQNGGWLFEGTVTEGYNDEVLIYQFNG